MSVFQSIYKCRLCGEIYADGATGSKSIMMKHLLHLTAGTDLPENIGTPVLKTTIHCCKDGSFGISDFHGFCKD